MALCCAAPWRFLSLRWLEEETPGRLGKNKTYRQRRRSVARGLEGSTGRSPASRHIPTDSTGNASHAHPSCNNCVPQRKASARRSTTADSREIRPLRPMVSHIYYFQSRAQALRSPPPDFEAPMDMAICNVRANWQAFSPLPHQRLTVDRQRVWMSPPALLEPSMQVYPSSTRHTHPGCARVQTSHAESLTSLHLQPSPQSAR